jgi:hypothetical protein
MLLRTGRARSLLVPALIGALVPALGACDGQGGAPSAAGSAAATATTATATAPTTAPATASAATDPVPPPPDDLAVAELQKALQCGGGKAGPCAIVSGFTGCTVWSANLPSGEGRWIGRGFTVEKGKTTEGIAMMRVRRVPTTEVGPGQLPVKLGIAELLADDPAYKQAGLAVRTYERQDTPPKNNAGVEHLKQRTDWVESFATRTAGGQVYALSGGGTFVCQGPKQQLLLVRRSGSRTDKADGVYAELWATTW